MPHYLHSTSYSLVHGRDFFFRYSLTSADRVDHPLATLTSNFPLHDGEVWASGPVRYSRSLDTLFTHTLLTLFSLLTMKSTFFLTSLALVTSIFALPQPQTQTTVTAPESIDQKFKSLGKKYFGTCTDKPLLVKGGNAVIIAKDFGQVTPENS